MWFAGWDESIFTALRSRRLEYTFESGGRFVPVIRGAVATTRDHSSRQSPKPDRDGERQNALNHGMIEFDEYLAVETKASQTSQEEQPTLCLRDAVPDERRPGQVAGDVDSEKFERFYLFHLGTVYYHRWDWCFFPAEIDHYLLSFRHVQFSLHHVTK